MCGVQGSPIPGDGFEGAGSRVTIILCTHNGARFLEAQLQSIAAQTHESWRLVVSDDASGDATLDILAQFSASRPLGQVEIRRRSFAIGATENFMSMLCDPDLAGDHFACCDQDDVWWPAKLERAVQWIEGVPAETPAAYFGRTRNVDADGRAIGFSPMFRKPPAFRNALVQSIGGGNTMLLNRAARALLVAAGAVQVPCHDWWTYLLVSGAGGRVHYDPLPLVDYRQHGGNQIGANQGLRARIKRARMVASGQLARWYGWHAAALEKSAALLTPENRELLELFRQMRDPALTKRLVGYARLRPYRQSGLTQFALFVALVGHRI